MNLTPRAKIGDVVIVKFFNQHTSQGVVYSAHIHNGVWWYSVLKNQEADLNDSFIIENLTTNTVYTGNEEQPLPKRWINANECLIHPGTKGHNC